MIKVLNYYDKLHARLTVLQNIIEEIEIQLDKRGIEYTLISDEVKEEKVKSEEIQEED